MLSRYLNEKIMHKLFISLIKYYISYSFSFLIQTCLQEINNKILSNSIIIFIIWGGEKKTGRLASGSKI